MQIWECDPCSLPTWSRWHQESPQHLQLSVCLVKPLAPSLVLKALPQFSLTPRAYSLVFPPSALASYLSLGCDAGMQPTLSGLYNLVLLRISSYMIFHTLPLGPVSLPLQISLSLPIVGSFEPTFRSNIPSWVSVCVCIHCLYPINCTNSETLGKECELELVH